MNNEDLRGIIAQYAEIVQQLSAMQKMGELACVGDEKFHHKEKEELESELSHLESDVSHLNDDLDDAEEQIIELETKLELYKQKCSRQTEHSSLLLSEVDKLQFLLKERDREHDDLRERYSLLDLKDKETLLNDLNQCKVLLEHKMAQCEQTALQLQ